VPPSSEKKPAVVSEKAVKLPQSGGKLWQRVMARPVEGNSRGEAMANRKRRRNRLVVLKALCALMVGGCLVLPLGGLAFPYLDIPNLPFSFIEAVFSATVGFGIADLLG
jgi:hypothetical protein